MDIVLEGVRTAVLPYPIGNQKDAFIINELLPGDVIDLKRSPASTRLPIGMFLELYNTICACFRFFWNRVSFKKLQKRVVQLYYNYIIFSKNNYK